MADSLVVITDHEGRRITAVVPNAHIIAGHVIGYQDSWNRSVNYQRKVGENESVQILEIKGDIHAELISRVHDLPETHHEQVKNFIETLTGV